MLRRNVCHWIRNRGTRKAGTKAGRVPLKQGGPRRWKEGGQGRAVVKWKMHPTNFRMWLTRSPSSTETDFYLVLFVDNKIGEYRRKLKNCSVYKKI